ncbi:tubulin-like doman-containing protein [Sulfolobus tengchongensis]|uniref:Tubulin-like doman-containing protein n=1 Tax=Sulfolobus tengchongensis TaxID=207809 RepID=A0AAX4L329_9CREN
MSVKASRYSSVHIVGLGGTGVNILQRLIESERFLDFISSEDSSIALLGIDVADGDIDALNRAAAEIRQKLASKGIPIDRFWLSTLKIRFNTPDTLYDFLTKFDKYLASEGIRVKNYMPWISRATMIPPLAGGVGRMRALSKAIYNLNYYYLTEVNNAIELFKDKVVRSVKTPVVVVVFGLGGGTGSGMITDFIRHLRAKLGNGIPIIGLAVLPSSADDANARGISSFMALNELELLFNTELNKRIVEIYGNAYENKFSALFFVPLDLVYNIKGNLVEAKKELDEAIVDILYMLMHFDLADLLSSVGTNNVFTENWVNSIGFLKIRYPVSDYIGYAKKLLELVKVSGRFVKESKDIFDMINKMFTYEYDELVNIFKQSEINTGEYNPELFQSKLNEIIEGRNYEPTIKMQIRSVMDYTQYYAKKFISALNNIRFEEDTIEGSAVSLELKELNKANELINNYENLNKNILNEVRERIRAGKNFTTTQREVMESAVDFSNLVISLVSTIKSYVKAKLLADDLTRRNLQIPDNMKTRINEIAERELNALSQLFQVLTMSPEKQVKILDEAISRLIDLLESSENRIRDAENQSLSVEREIQRLTSEKEELKKEYNKIRIDFSGKKKRIADAIADIDARISSLTKINEENKQTLDKIKDFYNSLKTLKDKLDVNKPYRANLLTLVNLERELVSILSNITRTTKYYEKVVELSEYEQNKIIEKILMEDQRLDKGDNNVLKEILDKKRFNEIMDSLMRVFRTPSYAGFNNNYKTDFIWVTVSIPEGLWDMDLQQRLMNILSSNIQVEASKAISIRQTSQIEPWTISIMVVYAKGTLKYLEKYNNMIKDVEAFKPNEKILFRSFLLEQGIWDLDTFIKELKKEEIEHEQSH